jgi:hypothetical protein
MVTWTNRRRHQETIPHVLQRIPAYDKLLEQYPQALLRWDNE